LLKEGIMNNPGSERDNDKQESGDDVVAEFTSAADAVASRLRSPKEVDRVAVDARTSTDEAQIIKR
jgi:hypothetical protein